MRRAASLPRNRDIAIQTRQHSNSTLYQRESVLQNVDKGRRIENSLDQVSAVAGNADRHIALSDENVVRDNRAFRLFLGNVRRFRCTFQLERGRALRFRVARLSQGVKETQEREPLNLFFGHTDFGRFRFRYLEAAAFQNLTIQVVDRLAGVNRFARHILGAVTLADFQEFRNARAFGRGRLFLGVAYCRLEFDFTSLVDFLFVRH